MRDVVKAYYSKCLQADLPAAIRAIKAKRALSKKARVLSRRVESRFIAKSESNSALCPDAFVSNVISAYRHYYREALLDKKSAKRHERELKNRIEVLLHTKGSWQTLEPALQRALRRRGYHSLLGVVAPFRSLLVWKKETSRTFRVPLLSGTENVKVVLLDQFVELGWMHFLTFGRHYVGGWAKKHALFCVAQAYKHDYESEAFRVSYLTHEAQHFSDYKKHPGLSSGELEYRAKLAELVASKRPAKLMEKFTAEAKNDPSLPHSFAACRVVRDIGAGPVRSRAAECLLRPPQPRARPRAGTRR